MSGKSTYLRQVALIVVMAQIGSFVPAQSAEIGIMDRVFTRIGAQEDLAAGQSTFMVEMVETANILNNAGLRSLIILDEVGRGTSTYDGLSIAWAIVEYIHNNPKLRSKTLFATHYHELVQIADILPRVHNYNVMVSEERGKIVFLRKVTEGSTDRSYGIHVAQLAGLPNTILNRANDILSVLNNKSGLFDLFKNDKLAKSKTTAQLPLFSEADELLKEMRNMEVDNITPLEAITKLFSLKKKAIEIAVSQE